jgi:DNA-directed RNA polymerase subunit M/transcription elongation factor TFIIS
MSGLPIVLNTAKYEVELPISKKRIEYRPYLVKEEKQLMLAMESQDPATIMKTVQDIIEACTFNKVKAKTLPTAELELLFLKLRSKSVGETSKVGYKCSSCGTVNQLSVNLEEVTIDMGDESRTNKVMITDSVGVMLKYPTTDEVMKIMASGDKTDIKTIFALVTSCIESIFDKENIYETKNLEKKEIDAFVESLNSKQFESIKDFFEGIPKLRKDVSFDCEKCGTHNPLVLEGLQNFFG